MCEDCVPTNTIQYDRYMDEVEDVIAEINSALLVSDDLQSLTVRWDDYFDMWRVNYIING